MLEKIIVATLSLGTIGLIYWFFFGKKDEATTSEGGVHILVDGGYKPGKIRIKKGVTTTLVFERKDPSTCLEEIVIPDFKIKKYLPLGEKVEIQLTPQKEGRYQTHCGMGMFHGQIIVE